MRAVAPGSAEPPPIVGVVDDDPSMRTALRRLLQAVGCVVETFDDAEDFLAHGFRPLGCLVLDVRMPGASGLDLQARLAATRPDLPVVMITGHPTADVHARALAAGAVAVLDKPFEEELLLEAVRRALTER
jgi:FixJ family two-component response regulator